MVFDTYLENLRRASAPAIWSRGILLSRECEFIVDAATDSEIIARVKSGEKTVTPKVTLWPLDEDWFCDCGAPTDPCAHIPAVAIAFKNGMIKPSASSNSVSAKIVYKFTRDQGRLLFGRYIRHGEEETLLHQPLAGLIGGIQSGRLQHPPIATTKEDFAVEAALGEKMRGLLDRHTLLRLFQALSDVRGITLDGQEVRVSRRPVRIRARIIDAPPGFRFERLREEGILETFSNGAVLFDGLLRPVDHPDFTREEREILSQRDGLYFSPNAFSRFKSYLLPELRKKIEIEILSEKLRGRYEIHPRIVVHLSREGEDQLSVYPSLVYGKPTIAKVTGEELEVYGSARIPDRDFARESALRKQLQSELHLQVDRKVVFSGDEAVNFAQDLAGWDVEGDGLAQFKLYPGLLPRFDVLDDTFDLRFELEGADPDLLRVGQTPGAPGASGRTAADPMRVLRAWRNGDRFVPLFGGGFAPLPVDWLNRHGKRVAALLDAKLNAKDVKKVLPAYLLPELMDLCEELKIDVPQALAKLKKGFADFAQIEEAPLPEDLQAQLRDYQIKGINWLQFLKRSEMGALLADDMGLGKTLQALCTLESRALIVCPTSVMHSWVEQISRFRPHLKVNTYYGTKRELNPQVDVTLTTYGLLRQDIEKLASQNWDTIILDEAQIIKNPTSQVARAAHSLRAQFKIALSGTPVENRLDDLWSQFQFINPGLLGSLEIFQDSFARPISHGDEETSHRLRKRIRPFILRRLKQEVAPELPPRTEITLHAELSETERELYESVLISARQEVREKLEKGGSIFAALEALLRLRQACCHMSLVPGQQAEGSSKVELLMSTLESSFAHGHRALVFSQWTSFLDLVEPHLKAAGIPFLRLDGTTRNRQKIVEDFQAPDGPPLLMMSLKAGGVGLTLTAADHIFLMDPWWNPAVEDQAADRAHRIGQENPVMIHRIVAKDTVEEKILKLQAKKQQIAGAVLKDAGQAASLTKEDILNLLS